MLCSGCLSPVLNISVFITSSVHKWSQLANFSEPARAGRGNGDYACSARQHGVNALLALRHECRFVEDVQRGVICANFIAPGRDSRHFAAALPLNRQQTRPLQWMAVLEPRFLIPPLLVHVVNDVLCL